MLKRLIIYILFLATTSFAGQFPPLADNSVLDLGPFTCTQLATDISCKHVTDYSGMTYDAANKRMLMFGGGHASTFTDTIFSLDTNTYPFTWTELYPPTLCSEMIPINYDQSRGVWLSGSNGPYPRPVARHTYDELVVINGEFLILAFMNGGQQLCPKGFDFSTKDPFMNFGSKIAHYTFSSGQWTFATTLADGFPDTGSTPAYLGAEVDPVSNLVIFAGRYGLWTYNPVTKTKTRRIRGEWGEWKNSAGQTVSFGLLGINPTVVYYPPTDRFYIIDYTVGFKIWRLTPNRTNWSQTRIDQMTISGTLPSCGQRKWAYDSTNQVLGVAVCNNVAFIFDPNTNTMVSQTVQGGTPGSVAFEALDYDPVNNVFVFINQFASSRTWAYRYKNGTSSSLQTPHNLQIKKQ